MSLLSVLLSVVIGLLCVVFSSSISAVVVSEIKVGLLCAVDKSPTEVTDLSVVSKGAVVWSIRVVLSSLCVNVYTDVVLYILVTAVFLVWTVARAVGTEGNVVRFGVASDVMSARLVTIGVLSSVCASEVVMVLVGTADVD